MLAVWKDWELDEILRNAYNAGVIMCGVSAGAICWFQKGITDSWKDHQATLDCLGFADGICCPHYDEEPERRPFVDQSLANKAINSCYSIDGGCALHMIDEKPFKSIVFEREKNAFLVTMDDLALNEKAFSKREIF